MIGCVYSIFSGLVGCLDTTGGDVDGGQQAKNISVLGVLLSNIRAGLHV